MLDDVGVERIAARARPGRALLLAGATLMLSACAHDGRFANRAPVLDSRFGDAVVRARAMQTLRPEGVVAADRDVSGRAAQAAIEAYYGAAAPGGQPTLPAGPAGSAGAASQPGASAPPPQPSSGAARR